VSFISTGAPGKTNANAVAAKTIERESSKIQLAANLFLNAPLRMTIHELLTLV
jgi:hypothetical protein